MWWCLWCDEIDPTLKNEDGLLKEKINCFFRMSENIRGCSYLFSSFVLFLIWPLSLDSETVALDISFILEESGKNSSHTDIIIVHSSSYKVIMKNYLKEREPSVFITTSDPFI